MSDGDSEAEHSEEAVKCCEQHEEDEEGEKGVLDDARQVVITTVNKQN